MKAVTSYPQLLGQVVRHQRMLVEGDHICHHNDLVVLHHRHRVVVHHICLCHEIHVDGVDLCPSNVIT